MANEENLKSYKKGQSQEIQKEGQKEVQKQDQQLRGIGLEVNQKFKESFNRREREP